MSLGKDTDLIGIYTFIKKSQVPKLDKIARMRGISKAKLIRELVDDGLKRLLVLGQDKLSI